MSGSAAQASDGVRSCGAVKFPCTFSYTPINASQPSSHRHKNTAGSGDTTWTKWERGNYTTRPGWHSTEYWLSGTNKGVWCEG